MISKVILNINIESKTVSKENSLKLQYKCFMKLIKTIRILRFYKCLLHFFRANHIPKARVRSGSTVKWYTKVRLENGSKWWAG